MLKSKWFKIAVCSALGLVVLLLVFLAGSYIGERKAEYEYHWGENYGRFFGEPRGGFFPNFPGGENMPQPTGMHAFGNGGVVLKVDGNNMAIKGNDNIEKVVAVDTSTVIRLEDQVITLSGIKPGDQVVVIGFPDNSGQILARFVRVFRQNETSTSTNNQ